MAEFKYLIDELYDSSWPIELILGPSHENLVNVQVCVYVFAVHASHWPAHDHAFLTWRYVDGRRE